MIRRGLARLAAGAALLTACGTPAPPLPTTPVVLITLDTTRADRLGCYGSDTALTPHLDRLAADGVVFERAFAQAAVTPVSHASILTGLEPYHHGVRVMHGQAANRLADEQTTLAEMLEAAGYRTAAFVSAFPVSERFGFAQGFQQFDATFGHEPDAQLLAEHGIVDTGKSQRHAGETTELALEWLAVPSDAPPFLWVHYFDPHDVQVLPPVEFLELPGGLEFRDRLRAAYDLEVRYMDLQIGRLLDRLREDRSYDDALIVVVADHGEGLGDHDWWTHGVLYQEQIRVPLIVKPPSATGGVRHPRVVRTVDLVPTVLELVGLPAPDGPALDGRSLVAALSGSAGTGDPAAYADSVNMLSYQFAQGITDQKDDMYFAIVEWPWKYIHHRLRPAESELYDLERDPRELDNRIAADPERAARMLDALSGRPYLPDDDLLEETMSDEDRKRLEALGYVK